MVGQYGTHVDYQSALFHVSYENNALRPELGNRLVHLSVFDGDGSQSNVITITVNMTNSTQTPTTAAPQISALIAHPQKKLEQGKNVYNGKQLSTAFAFACLGLDVHTDAKISSGDEIKIFFNVETNMAPFGFYDVDDPVSSFGKVLGLTEITKMFNLPNFITANDAVVGKWESPKVFSMLVIKEGYPQPSVQVVLPTKQLTLLQNIFQNTFVSFQIGSWKISPHQIDTCTNTPANRYCIRDVSGRSAAATEQSPYLQGSWGLNVCACVFFHKRNLFLRNKKTFV